MSSSRAIAMLLVLAVFLAGPVTALGGALNECCCSQSESVVSGDQDLNTDCCTAPDVPEEPSPGSTHDDDHEHQSCDCTMPCCTAGKTTPLSRAAIDLDLPEFEPYAFVTREPESHAIEPHFSLLRPPRI